jgi:hypothetical protein
VDSGYAAAPLDEIELERACGALDVPFGAARNHGRRPWAAIKVLERF